MNIVDIARNGSVYSLEDPKFVWSPGAILSVSLSLRFLQSLETRPGPDTFFSGSLFRTRSQYSLRMARVESTALVSRMAMRRIRCLIFTGRSACLRERAGAFTIDNLQQGRSVFEIRMDLGNTSKMVRNELIEDSHRHNRSLFHLQTG